jgi:Flp pilus assembly protein TadD
MRIFFDSATISGRRHGGGVAVFAALLLAGCAQNHQAAVSPVGPDTLSVSDATVVNGDPNGILGFSQAALSRDPDNVAALEQEGNSDYALGRYGDAIAAYQLALKQNSTATSAQIGLGRALLKSDPHAAELAFEQAVQDDPGNAAALNDLGIARDLQGNFAGAVDPYKRALQADPALTAAAVNLGMSLALSGNGPEAMQYLGPLANSQSATPKIREDYAAALVASGRSDEARGVLGVDLPPDDVVSAMSGFSTVISQAQAQANAPPPAPTVTTVTTTVVTPAPAVLTPGPTADAGLGLPCNWAR